MKRLDDMGVPPDLADRLAEGTVVEGADALILEHDLDVVDALLDRLIGSPIERSE